MAEGRVHAAMDEVERQADRLVMKAFNGSGFALRIQLHRVEKAVRELEAAEREPESRYERPVEREDTEA